MKRWLYKRVSCVGRPSDGPGCVGQGFPAVQPRPPVPVRGGRRGMSLLEVLLASGLCMILMLAVYASVNQAYRLRLNGAVEMERMQLARAIVRQLEMDLRSVSYSPPKAKSSAADEGLWNVSGESSGTGGSGSGSGSSGGGSGSGGSGSGSGGSSGGSGAGEGEESTSVTIESPVDELLAGSIGLVGKPQRLELHVSRPKRELAFQAANASAATVSDLRSVIYTFQAVGTDGPVDPVTGKMLSGLIRSDGDRMSVINVETAGTAGELATPPQSLAPEVVSLVFRYFDGAVWYEEWDTPTSGRLPRAVEVSVMFDAPASGGGAVGNASVSERTKQLRFVIALPTADPAAGDNL